MVFESIVAALAAFFDLFLFPLAILPASVSLLLIAGVLTVIVFVVNRLLVNKDDMKKIKTQIEETREKLTTAQKAGDKEQILKHMNDLWASNNKYIRLSMKTMVVSLIIVSLFLPWLRTHYTGQNVASLPFSVPFIGSSVNWIYWYVFVSLGVGWCFRKILGE